MSEQSTAATTMSEVDPRDVIASIVEPIVSRLEEETRQRETEAHEIGIAEIKDRMRHRSVYEALLAKSVENGSRQAEALERIARALECSIVQSEAA